METLFHICSVEEYDAGVESGIKLTQEVKGYKPRYSPDGTEVLVTGYGTMTSEQAIEYISLNWKIAEDI